MNSLYFINKPKQNKKIQAYNSLITFGTFAISVVEGNHFHIMYVKLCVVFVSVTGSVCQ